jgi:hypothetical protein
LGVGGKSDETTMSAGGKDAFSHAVLLGLRCIETFPQTFKAIDHSLDIYEIEIEIEEYTSSGLNL